MTTEDHGKEVAKGQLLDAWLEDLRSQRSPRPMPEAASLSTGEVEEVLELARWMKASLYPAATSGLAVGDLVSSVRNVMAHDEAANAQAVSETVEGSEEFGHLVSRVRRLRNIDAIRLEQALTLPSGTIRRLETGELPPHRLPVEKMLPLLRSLRLTSTLVVDLVRRTSLEWLAASFGSGLQTRLGRLDVGLSNVERRELLAAHEHLSETVDEERARVGRYCDQLGSLLS